MDKIFLQTNRVCRASYHLLQRTSTVHLSWSCNLRQGEGGLDEDPSWEAGVLRHEKRLHFLQKKGVKPDDLPDLDREEKVKNLPHLSFRDKEKFEKDESLLDETYKLLLGSSISSAAVSSSVKALTNLDPDFARDDVQEVLHRIHYSCDLQKVYKQHVKERKDMPLIKYLTDEQLNQEMEKIRDEVIERLRMPPVMLVRKPCSEILSEDHVLEGYEESNISFFDISEGLSNRERFIFIREPNGVLRKAEWEERDRLTQVYYPSPNRKIIPPSFFQDENIETIFKNYLHENALDQCVAQYEADSKEYIQIFETIYSDIDRQKLYDSLRSTRYFGGLVYYLAKNRRIDSIVLDMLNKDMLDNARDCVILFTLLHPGCNTKHDIQGLSHNDAFSIIRAYIDSDSSDKKLLSLALNRNQATEETAAESTV